MAEKVLINGQLLTKPLRGMGIYLKNILENSSVADTSVITNGNLNKNFLQVCL